MPLNTFSLVSPCGWVWTLQLRIESLLRYHCATAAAQDRTLASVKKHSSLFFLSVNDEKKVFEKMTNRRRLTRSPRSCSRIWISAPKNTTRWCWVCSGSLPSLAVSCCGTACGRDKGFLAKRDRPYKTIGGIMYSWDKCQCYKLFLFVVKSWII